MQLLIVFLLISSSDNGVIETLVKISAKCHASLFAAEQSRTTVNFLNFRTPENLAVTNLPKIETKTPNLREFHHKR